MNISREQLENLFAGFSNLKVLILGDVMIDSYLTGKVERISPEAPVPVVLVNHKSNMLGGAANVALNIRSLGAVPVLCSVIGDDTKGADFIRLLEREHIDTSAILKSGHRITTTKTRIIGNKAQLLRVDEEITDDLGAADTHRLLVKLDALMEQADIKAIILQDYNKGVLTPEVISHIIALGKRLNVPVVVDPKHKNFNAYRQVDLFKPNLKELREGLKQEIDLKDIEKIKSACADWQHQQEITSMMVTLSENGLYMREILDGHTKEYHIPAHLRNIADVSGAGDTVISVASLCRALDTDTWITAALSNIAGGLVCEQLGVVPVNGKQLLEEAIELLK